MSTCVWFGGNLQNQFLKQERQACTPCMAHFGFPIFIGQCQRPNSGCSWMHFDIYKSVDCDGDGILDHACSNDNNRWLVLSSEGCPSSWGPASRPVSDCPQAFGGTIAKIQQEFDAACSCT